MSLPSSAVMILRRFEKARRLEEKRAQQPCKEREIQDKIVKEKETDKRLLFVRLTFEGKMHLWELWLSLFLLRPSTDLNLLQATVGEGGPTSGCTNAHAARVRNPVTPQETSSERKPQTQLPAGNGKHFHGRIERQTLITNYLARLTNGTSAFWQSDFNLFWRTCALSALRWLTARRRRRRRRTGWQRGIIHRRISPDTWWWWWWFVWVNIKKNKNNNSRPQSIYLLQRWMK